MIPTPYEHTDTLLALGRKVVAIAPAPKPHVHQWLAVPDSKIHSRCAECGAVTLTEIVAPKPAAFTFIPNDGLTQMLKEIWAAVDAAAGVDSAFLVRAPEQASPAGKTATEVMMKALASERRLVAWAEIGEAFAKIFAKPQAPEITNSQLTAAVHEFLAGSADRTLAKAHARSVLDRMGCKKMFEVPQHRRAEFLKALTTGPTKHYTSIAGRDGKVRMVETDAEGWIKNDGTQPVADDVRVDVQTGMNGGYMTFAASTFAWQNVTHWRPA